MTTETTNNPVPCVRCGEAVIRNMVGGYFAPGRAAMGAGHYSTTCAPLHIHSHKIA